MMGRQTQDRRSMLCATWVLRALITSGLVTQAACLDLDPNASPDTVHTTVAESSLAGLALATELEGQWQAQSVSRGACPHELGHSPLQGVTSWRRDGDRLTITQTRPQRAQVTLQALDDGSLWRQDVVTWEGCELEGEVLITFSTRNQGERRGHYSAHYNHVDGSACRALQAHVALPSNCQVSADWRAVRVSMHP